MGNELETSLSNRTTRQSTPRKLPGTYQSTKIKKMDCLIYQNSDNIMLLYFLVIVI